ncbi:MAG TPA: hypothetical protein PLU47_15855 [Azonexus sp.]|nr:hypothetical protein [Azonexus sp.]
MTPPCSNPNTLLALALTASLLFGCQTGISPANAQSQPPGTLSTQERIKRGQALFDEKCKTVAGEKIYKTVPEVEGVLLLKVRPRVGGNEWADKMWPGAAFALEATADEFINTFLGYEEAFSKEGPRAITQKNRGYINTSFKPGFKEHPGYRYVDIIDDKDGKRYRHVLAQKQRPNSTIGWIDVVLNKTSAPDPTPRYAVTYEDHVVPEERALWLASGTVKVIDQQTGEVLGEMTRYAWSAGAPTAANPSPWLTAYKCPGHAEAAGSATRMFVDQILIPKKEK